MKVVGMTSQGRRVRACALGTSAITLAMVLGAPAHAQCSPDPATANGITTCAGTDSDGLTVTAANTRIVVAAGASVRPGNASAAILSTSANTQFQIGGLVDGGAGKPGLFITTGPATTAPCDPYAGASVGYCVPGSIVTVSPSGSATIGVLQGGTVTGAQGILIRRDPNNPNGTVSTTLNNAGTIAGTAGPAVVADQTGFGSLSVTNAATGTIGGIAGTVSYVTNRAV